MHYFNSDCIRGWHKCSPLVVDGEIVVEDAELRAISSDTKRIREALGRDYVSLDAFETIRGLEETAKEQAGNGLTMLLQRSFHETTSGKDPIAEERAEVAELLGREPELSYLREHRIVCMTFSHDGADHRILCPPEYPLNGPTLMDREGGTGEFQEIVLHIARKKGFGTQ